MSATLDLVRTAVVALRARGFTLAVAESLTGGALASAIVEVSGVSDVFRGGAVSYATDVKSSVLGVSEERLAQTGPVDREVALEMARGACRLFRADVAMATTGVAGPGPSDGHPAGTVWVALSGKIGEEAVEFHFEGGRAQVRACAVEAALSLLHSRI